MRYGSTTRWHWRKVADDLAAALRGWEMLDKACDDASGRADDPAVQAAEERLGATFEAVWAKRDAALAKYEALVDGVVTSEEPPKP